MSDEEKARGRRVLRHNPILGGSANYQLSIINYRLIIGQRRQRSVSACLWRLLSLLVVVLYALGSPGPLRAQATADSDFDGSGTVDFADFLLFAQAFGSTESRYDLDGSGTVDFADFLGLVRVFGQAVTPSEQPEPQAEITVALPGGATAEFVWIKPGSFAMGAPISEPGRADTEGPQHEVTLSEGFYLGRYEVTQAQWASVMATEPWVGQSQAVANPQHPAVYVSWDDAQAFVQKLNEAAGEAIYRLPTEAEWEYACRAGTTSRWSFGDDETLLGDYAWYSGNAWDARERYAHTVGAKLPNPWGLHDMHGNVYELVQDWYSDSYYGSSPDVDPTGPGEGENRARRGGSFYSLPGDLRSAARRSVSPSTAGGLTGFRLVNRKPVLSVNRPPAADAGWDRRALVGRRTMLNGAASSDPDGDALTYTWLQMGGASVGLSDSASAWPIFTPPEAGTYVFALTVNDGELDSPPDVVFVLVVDSGASYGQVAVIQPGDQAGKDVFVGYDADGQAQDTQYDENGALYCGASASGNTYDEDTRFRSYLETALTGLPADAEVQSATLSLYCTWADSSAEAMVSLYPVTAPWAEDGVTWLTAPPEAGGATSSTPVGESGQWYSWDVTELVKGWQAGGENLGVMLRDQDEDFDHFGVKRFASSEDSTASHRPRLNMVYETGGDGVITPAYNGLVGYAVSHPLLVDSRGLPGSRTGYDVSGRVILDARRGRTGFSESNIFSLFFGD